MRGELHGAWWIALGFGATLAAVVPAVRAGSVRPLAPQPVVLRAEAAAPAPALAPELARRFDALALVIRDHPGPTRQAAVQESERLMQGLPHAQLLEAVRRLDARTGAAGRP
jgi:hypothetical protein